MYSYLAEDVKQSSNLLHTPITNEFITECNDISRKFSDNLFNEIPDEVPNPINSCYYDLQQLNRITHDKSASL